MSPFREAPKIELGPLDVGLETAVRRATARLPRGGRLVATRSAREGPSIARRPGARPGARGEPDPAVTDRPGPHRTGALGSAGLVLVGATALVAWATGWQPASVADLAASVPVVVFGGISLAAVFRAVDRTGSALVQRGEIVGREARAVLRRLARLEAHARRGRADPGRAVALQRALAAAAAPEIAPWIPADVRGRAELLLARLLATTSGPSRLGRGGVVREVRALLRRAEEHLDDAAPARADLAEIARIPDRAAFSTTGVAPHAPRHPRAGTGRVALGDEAGDLLADEDGDALADEAAPCEGSRAGRW